MKEDREEEMDEYLKGKTDSEIVQQQQEMERKIMM